MSDEPERPADEAPEPADGGWSSSPAAPGRPSPPTPESPPGHAPPSAGSAVSRVGGWFRRLPALGRSQSPDAPPTGDVPWRTPGAREVADPQVPSPPAPAASEPVASEPPALPPTAWQPAAAEPPAGSAFRFGQPTIDTPPPAPPPVPAQPPLFEAPSTADDTSATVLASAAEMPAVADATDEIDEAAEIVEAAEAMPPPVPPLTAEAAELPLPEPDPDPETPAEAAEEEQEAQLIAKGGPFSRFAWPSHPRYWNGYLAVLTGLATLAILMFVLVEPSPRWILLVAAGAVAVGLDGALRATWRAAFADGEDTTPYLFLPALYVFAAPVLIEHNASGHLVLLWGLIAGLGFGALAVAEVLSVRTGSRLYPYARMVTTGTAYFTAFSLLSMTYVLHLALAPAILATWLVGAMLAVEIVREGEVDPVETAVFAAVAGLVLSQVRWLLYFLPVDGYLAGLTLVLVFYCVAGVLHSYVIRQLTPVTAAEYALVTAIGMVLVGAARVTGLA